MRGHDEHEHGRSVEHASRATMVARASGEATHGLDALQA
jgi:hypothetical protein